MKGPISGDAVSAGLHRLAKSDPVQTGPIVGGRHGKHDALELMTGAGKYADDIDLPRMLHCKLLRSPHPHARIVAVDTSRAEAMEGVHGVVVGAEMPIPYGVIPWTPDENALALHKVRFIGDPVAAVAAVSEEVANEACRRIAVTYELLEPLTWPEQALAEKHNKIHEDNKHGNITKHVQLAFGEVDAQLAAAELVIEGHYRFHGSTHAPIEPHCAVAQVDGKGLLTVWSATQVPHYLQRELAKVLELPMRQIRVIQPAVGGAFGGKSEPFALEFCVAKLAQKTGRPVKCLYTREEVFLAHRGRHPFDMRYRTGFSRDGRILAVDAKSLLDGGAYSSFGLVTTYYSGQLLGAPYVFPAYRFDSTRVYTNKPACGPKRGHGSVQPRFALEVQLDKASRALGIDPIELRRRNFMGDNAVTVNGFHVGSNGFLQCLDAAAYASGWADKWGQLPRGRGIGVAGSCYISGTNYCIYPTELPQSAVQIGIDRSGRVRVFAGTSDIGQGSTTMLAAITAHELGVELDDVRVLAADSDLCPVDLGAYSSRITLMAGNACLNGARMLGDRIRGVLAELWQVDAAEIRLEHRRAFAAGNPELWMPIQEAFIVAEGKLGMLGQTGSYTTPKTGVHGDYRGGTIGASPAYSFTVHIAEVQVDEETGDVAVDRIWCAHDCGKAINPVLVEGQIEGSVYMGAAEALLEHHDAMPSGLREGGQSRLAGPGREGLLMASSLLDYRMPTSLDVPQIDALIVEAPDPRGPYGAKEAGEGPLHSAIPAIANAIFDAVGVRIDHLPISPAKVLAGLREQARGEPC